MTDFSEGYAAGDTAPTNVYLIHGRYEDVEDLDGSLVEIERVYSPDVLATELGDRERGNLLVAADSVIDADTAARIAAG